MRLAFWFFPVWSGDFRLERQGEDECLLTVEDPTDADRTRLYPFLAAARQKGWMPDEDVAIATTGETKLAVRAPLSVAGPVLAGVAHGKAETWTAVRFAKGTMLFDGAPAPAPDAEAAVTVTPPKKGCPAPTAAERRSSQVLTAFSTERQMGMWSEHGWMPVIGNASGRAYRLYHRDEAAKRGIPRLLVRASDGEPVCVWDDRVPPAEEALSIKFAVEHREAWLLNLSRYVN